jgi:hypothetical protein
VSLLTLFTNLEHKIQGDTLDFHEYPLEFQELLDSFTILNFQETGLILKDLIESVYTTGIHSLDDVDEKDGVITGVFQDKSDSKKPRKFKFTIDENKIVYKEILDPEFSELDVEFSDFLNGIVDFKAPKTPPAAKKGEKTKADKLGRVQVCDPSKSFVCGASCQKNGRNCASKVSTPEQKQQYRQVVERSQQMKSEDLGQYLTSKKTPNKKEKVLYKKELEATDETPAPSVKEVTTPKPEKRASNLSQYMTTKGSVATSKTRLTKSDSSLGATLKKVFDRFKDRVGKVIDSSAAKVEQMLFGGTSDKPEKEKPSSPPKINKPAVQPEKPKEYLEIKPKNPQIKVNSNELQEKRESLVAKFGEKLVTDAENNVSKIINDKDTNVYIRVGSSETLGFILGDRFKPAHELGGRPGGADDYLAKRARVEEKTLGYSKDTEPSDRPIYGYLGGSDLKGTAHQDAGKAYGSISVKLKPDIKDRATFTGADSFKSGIASEIRPGETPPPPSAASLVPSTRGGKDITEEKRRNDKKYLDHAAKSENIDDLVSGLASSGNRYMEAQLHGKVGLTDIAELHFNPESDRDSPNESIFDIAEQHNISVFVSGEKVTRDFLKRAAPETTEQLKENESNK